jgi:hypothetical protein
VMAEKGCLKRLQKEYHSLCKVRLSVWIGFDWIVLMRLVSMRF